MFESLLLLLRRQTLLQSIQQSPLFWKYCWYIPPPPIYLLAVLCDLEKLQGNYDVHIVACGVQKWNSRVISLVFILPVTVVAG